MYLCVLSSPPDPDDIPYDPSSYFTEHRWEHHIPDPQNYRGQIDQLRQKGFDVFVNLCDGTPDDELSGIGLVNFLEERKIPFTGAASSFFDPTRHEMKVAAKLANIRIPASEFVKSVSDLDAIQHHLDYPLLVKPQHGYASVGITRESRVENFADLKKQTGITLARFGGALIEQFIDGREFTTLVAENFQDPGNPISFQPVEFMFPDGEGFKHYDMKWKYYERMSVKPVCEPEINMQLREFASRQFNYMHGSGYARCDFRMDREGNIYLLEINPNCGVFYPPDEPGSADFILLNDPMGHHGFLNIIIQSALGKFSSR